MPGFNGGTIPAALLNNLLTPAERIGFEQFIYRALPVETFPTMRGFAPNLPIPQGMAATHSDIRDLFVARGAPTPKANFELGERNFRLHEAREAAGIDHISDKELKYYTSEIKNIMSNNVGLAVATKFELLLAGLLRGVGQAEADGTTTDIEVLDNAQRFDVYGVDGIGYSDVALTIELAIKGGHGRNAIIGDNVMRALARHPQFTNRFTGNGREILGQSQVLETLREFGLTGTIWAASHEYSSNPREQAYSRSEFFDNVFAVFHDGAIRQGQLQGEGGMYFDTYDDKDTKVEYLRAQEVNGIWIPHAAEVLVHQNVLTP